MNLWTFNDLHERPKYSEWLGYAPHNIGLFIRELDPRNAVIAAADAIATAGHIIADKVEGGPPSGLSTIPIFFGRAIHSQRVALSGPIEEFISQAQFDVSQIHRFAGRSNISDRIKSLPLWRDNMPAEMQLIWERARPTLIAGNDGFALWANWYDRRLKGSSKGFVSGPENDAELHRRIISKDSAWWDREPALVNSDIAEWLDELSPPIRDPMRLLEPAPDPLDALLADPQFAAAPRFAEDSDGRVAIDPQAGSDELLTDVRAVERHAAARSRAVAVAERLKGHNQADYLSGLAQDVYAALGDNITKGDLAETLLLANQIRRAEQQHATAGASSDILPLPHDAARNLAGLIEALNLHIGQQPVLAAMDVAALGPDVAVVLASPDDARQLLGDREAARGFSARTRDYIDVAADLAPAEPDPANRQSRRLSGLMANLGRYVVQKVSEHRLALLPLGGGAAAGATMAFVGVAGVLPALGGAAYLLCNMKKHPDVWMRLAGPAPASRANMRLVLDFLDEYWPSESAMDNRAKNS